MKYLYVVAHPDDEMLGAGATIIKQLRNGDDVYVCIMNSEDDTRYYDNQGELLDDTLKCSKEIGYTGLIVGRFPNLRFNTVEHFALVQFIEEAIEKFQPDVVMTHHPSDPNNDHVHTSLACQVAFRSGQRMRGGVKPVSALYFMEVKSATDWALNAKFNPNTFSEVMAEDVDRKIEVLKLYENVVREHPHPRSEEAIKALAVYRGSQCGFCYAEAFELAFRRGV